MSPFCVAHTFSITSLAHVAPSNNTFKDSFLKLLFIESGSGYFYLNDKKHVYKCRDILIIPGNGNFIMEEGHQTCFNIYTFLDPFSMANKLTDCLTGLRHIEKYQSPQLFTAQENEVLQDQALLWSFHDSIQEECHKKRHLHVELITAMAAACLRIVARNTTTADKSKSGDQESDLISKMILYIDSNIHKSSHLRIAALAQTFDITKNALSHLFKKKTGKSIYHYVIVTRLDHAKDQLTATDFTVAQIAIQLGFTDESHLTRSFKKYVDCSPKEFRETH
jgi:AraC-like DNA-binding protein